MLLALAAPDHSFSDRILRRQTYRVQDSATSMKRPVAMIVLGVMVSTINQVILPEIRQLARLRLCFFLHQ